LLKDAAVHLEQAMQRYLKGALDELGSFTREHKTHDIPRLIDILIAELAEERLQDYKDIGARLAEIYRTRYPDVSPADIGLSREALAKWAKAIRRMKALLLEGFKT